MMYASAQGTDHFEDQITADTAVLVKIKLDDKGNQIGPADDWRVPERQSVSAKDAAFAKKWYPWDQAAYLHYLETQTNANPNANPNAGK